MKLSTESLVSWAATGAILIGVGLFVSLRGWLTLQQQLPVEYYRRSPVDPSLAVGGGLVLVVVGLLLVGRAIIGRLRRDD